MFVQVFLPAMATADEFYYRLCRRIVSAVDRCPGPQLIVTTSERPDWSASCVAHQIQRSSSLLSSSSSLSLGNNNNNNNNHNIRIPVVAIDGTSTSTGAIAILPDGVRHAAAMIEASDRTDWVYIVVGGQSSLEALIRYDNSEEHNDEGHDNGHGHDNDQGQGHSKGSILAKIEHLVIMGGNWCTGPAAEATIDLYRAWSAAARADPKLLVHKEAMAFDPASESTPQFDAVAVLVAMDLVRNKNKNNNNNNNNQHRVALREFANGKQKQKHKPASIRAALGFVSPEAEQEFFHEMALRISGRWRPPREDTGTEFDVDSYIDSNIDSNIESLGSEPTLTLTDTDTQTETITTTITTIGTAVPEEEEEEPLPPPVPEPLSILDLAIEVYSQLA
eukprot:jgi/Psemu1/286270/fgenesh1_pg.128_\